MHEPYEYELVPTDELIAADDGTIVHDNEGGQWEKQAGWWRLKDAHMFLNSHELAASASPLFRLVLLDAGRVACVWVGGSQENRGFPRE